MQDIVIGRILRALRRRRGWRQIDLALRAGVSQTVISTIERGHLSRTSVDTLRRVFAALDVRLELTASWRGAELDRLLDEDHARLVALVAGRLEKSGWQVVLEVTYSSFGERGSIDVLGLRPDLQAALVVEVKGSVGSTEATGRKVDEKTRLAPSIVERRFGWRPRVIGRVLAVPGTMRVRRLIAVSEALRRMFPAGAHERRRWLGAPAGSLAAVWFLSDNGHRNLREPGGARSRVRVRTPNVGDAWTSGPAAS